MATLVGSYRFTAAGYDAANTRLIDESGMGNHLPLIAGSPDFTGSYDSKTAFKMFGTAYFGGPNILLPECWSAISVLHPNISGAETLNYIWGSGRYYAYSDPGHLTASQPFEDGTSSPAQLYAQRGRISGTGGLTGTDINSVSTTTGYVSDDWNVVTDVWNGTTGVVKKRFGTAATATGTISQHYQLSMMEEIRLGYRPTALTTTGTYHLGCLRIDIYAGDITVDDPAGYAARVAALVATPDL